MNRNTFERYVNNLQVSGEEIARLLRDYDTSLDKVKYCDRVLSRFGAVRNKQTKLGSIPHTS